MISKLTTIIEKLRCVNRYGFLDAEEKQVLNRVGLANLQKCDPSKDTYTDVDGPLDREDLVRISPEWKPKFVEKVIEIQHLKQLGVRGFMCPNTGAKIPLSAAYSIDGFAGYILEGDDKNVRVQIPFKETKRDGYRQAKYAVVYTDLDTSNG